MKRHVTRLRGRALALFVLSVAALCLSAELAAALHTALVPHVVCQEHGEWVHGDASNSHGNSALVGSPAGPRRVAVTSGDAEEEHAHDVCFAGRVQAPWPSGSDRWEPAAALTVSGDSTLVAVATPGAERLYALAPKTSPPRA